VIDIADAEAVDVHCRGGGPARRPGGADLDRWIADWTRTRQRDEVVAVLRAAGLRAAPVLGISELFDDPQLRHRAFWPTVEHPVIGPMHLMSAPFRLSATPSVQQQAGPTLGADNALVFGGILGLTSEERATLESDDVFA